MGFTSRIVDSFSDNFKTYLIKLEFIFIKYTKFSTWWNVPVLYINDIVRVLFVSSLTFFKHHSDPRTFFCLCYCCRAARTMRSTNTQNKRRLFQIVFCSAGAGDVVQLET